MRNSLSVCAMLVTLPAMLLPFRSASAQSTTGYPPGSGTTTGGTTSGGTGTTGYPGTTTGGTTSSGTTTGGTTTTGTTGTPTPPAGSIHVIWNSDATTTPNLQQAATGGPVGDVGKVHVSFPIPANAFDITLKELRIHEAAGHYDDTVASSPNIVDGTWSPLCGDPDPSQANAPQMQYYDVNWTITGCHNGPHIITATVEYQLYDPTNGNSTGPYDTPYQMGVDVENLLITRTHVNTNSNGAQAPGTPSNSDTDNPNPILWDPASMASVDLSADITAAYSSNCTVTLTIYSSIQGLVKTLTKTVNVGGLSTQPGPPSTTSIVSTPVTFNWDGSTDNGSSSGYPGGGGTSAQAVKGIYLYQFNIASLGGYDDYDQDKSPFLTISSPAPTSEFLSDDGGSAIHRVWYQMASLDQPDPGRSASEGQIQIYDQETNMTALLQLAGMGPDPAPLTPGPHVVQATFPSPQEPSHVHLLVCPKDADADHDKGHRNRWALQHNQRGGKGSTIAFDYGGSDFFSLNPTQQPLKAGQVSWQPGMAGMGYHNLVGDEATTIYNRFVWPITLGQVWSALFKSDPALVDYEWCEYNANSQRITNALLWTDHAGNKQLQALLIAGHGGADGSRVCVRGTDVNDPKPAPGDQTYIVSALTAAELPAHPAMASQDELVLTSLNNGGTNLSGITIPPSQTPLSNLKLVVIAACDAGLAQSTGDWATGIHTLSDQFLGLGVKCVVSVGEADQNENGIDAYLGAFLKSLAANNSVRQADIDGNAEAVKDGYATGNKISTVGGDDSVHL